MTLLLATGLFAAPALAFDHSHAAFAGVLDGAVTPQGVDYDKVASRKDDLLKYLETVADANVKTFSDEQKLAFYVNSYNALTINLIVTKGQPASIKDLYGGKPWDAASWPVGREKLTLNQIEHDRVRPMTDGRAHAVVNCASKGCPPLPPKPLTPEAVQNQLDAGAKRWVATNAFEVEGKVVKVSAIFKWYAEDFTGMPKGTASEAEMFAAARAFIEKYGGKLPDGDDVKYEWNDYDWSLNDVG